MQVIKYYIFVLANTVEFNIKLYVIQILVWRNTERQMHDGIVVLLVELLRESLNLLYKTTFVINVKIKSDFITNTVF
jgi:hypothetical protein